MFTYFLLKKLQETKGDASLEELGMYIQKHVIQQSMMEIGKPQTPSINVSSSLSTSWKTQKIY